MHIPGQPKNKLLALVWECLLHMQLDEGFAFSFSAWE